MVRPAFYLVGDGTRFSHRASEWGSLRSSLLQVLRPLVSGCANKDTQSPTRGNDSTPLGTAPQVSFAVLEFGPRQTSAGVTETT
jgi:hypothetical protein